MSRDIRILIVDDHAIVREGQRALIETEPGMILIGEAMGSKPLNWRTH